MNKTLTKFASVALGAAMIAVPLAITRAAAPDWNASGNYVIAFDYLGSDYAHDLTLSQNGSGNLTGNGGNPAGGAHTYTWVIDSGTVDGDNISFTAHYTASADAVTPLTVMHVNGTIDSDGTMSGTWDDNYQGGSRSGTWESTSGTADEVTPLSSTVVVSGNTSAGENQAGWMFNRDATTATPYEFNTEAASIGTGSIEVLPIGANASDKFIAENFLNTAVEDVDSLSFDFKIAGNGDAADANQFYMNVYANFGQSDDLKFYDCRYNVIATTGSTAGFTTVTFDPTQAYDVTTRGGANASPFACPAVPADMDNLSAGSNIRAFSISVGDTSASDAGLGGYVDKAVVALDSAVTTYNFDPIAPVDVCANIPGNQATVPPGKVQDGPNCVDPAPVPTGPTNKDQCKNNGWKTFTNPSFKNQGQCVSSTNH